MKIPARQHLNEDWVSVLIASVIIALTLLIYEWVPTLPMLFNAKEKWSGVEFLSGFLSRPNQIGRASCRERV